MRPACSGHHSTPWAPQSAYPVRSLPPLPARLQLEAEAVNGPTVDRGQLPPFDWSRRFPGLSHRGQPKRFAFEFERMSAAAVEEAAAAAGAGCHGGAGGDGELLQAQ